MTAGYRNKGKMRWFWFWVCECSRPAKAAAQIFRRAEKRRRKQEERAQIKRALRERDEGYRADLEYVADVMGDFDIDEAPEPFDDLGLGYDDYDDWDWLDEHEPFPQSDHIDWPDN